MCLTSFLIELGSRDRQPIMHGGIPTVGRRGAEQARNHAHAVFLALREALGDKEFFDVTVQLPPEYAVLWIRR
jgi:hypothetical protein